MSNSPQLYERALNDAIGELKKYLSGTASEKKISDGLCRWALEKMGTDRAEYMQQGTRNFLALVAQEMVMKGCDVGTAISSLPYLIPLNIPRKRTLPFDRVEDLLNVAIKYYTLLPLLTDRKDKSKTGAAFRWGLNQVLPGAKTEWLKTINLSTESSDIAVQYLAQRYKLALGAEALKKWLGTIENAQKRQRWLESRLIATGFTKENQKLLRKLNLSIRNLP